MKLRQKITAVFLSAVLLLLTACGTAPEQVQGAAPERSTPTIRFLLRGTAAGMDRVREALYAQMDDILITRKNDESRDSMYYLGVDLGGTNIKAALVTENGDVVKEASTPTNLPSTAEAVCDDIAALCLQLGEGERVAAIGVGCPGTVDDGVVLYSNNLDWHDFSMADYLRNKTGLPVFVGNDANVAALGEALVGCGRNAESTVIVTLGTGVGAGVVLGGKLLTGYTGAASEAGHMVILDTPDAPRCTCGRPGCFEALASATALIRMTRDARRAHPESALNALAPAEADVTGRTAFDAAAQGDAAGQEVVDKYVHYLAVGVANLINIFFPEVIGLSGGVANQGENLLKPLRAAVGPMTFGNAFAKKHTRLTTCTLGYRAGVIGAALLAKQEG